MNEQKYYFERDNESLTVGEMIDSLPKFHSAIFKRLYVDDENYENIAEDLNSHPEVIEEIEEKVFEALKPVVGFLMDKEFEDDDVLNDVERDFVIDVFRNEIHFRKGRAEFLKARGMSHVPA